MFPILFQGGSDGRSTDLTTNPYGFCRVVTLSSRSLTRAGVVFGSDFYIPTFFGPFSVRIRDPRTIGPALGKPAGSKSPHPGTALFNTEARSKRSNRSMVRLAHHDRLDLPLVLRLVEGCASFKTFNWARQPGQNWHYFTGFAGVLTRDVIVIRERGGTFTF
jgi:hypothetical protein